MGTIWRHFLSPIWANVVVRVHVSDMGKAAVYERWGWIEVMPEWEWGCP